MIYLVKVYYEDNVGKITGYRQLPDGDVWDQTKFKQVSQPIYDYIVEKYQQGEMTFNDAIVELNIDNIDFKPFDQITAMKNNATNLYIKNELRNDDFAFDFFLISTKFTLLNNQFLAAGFFFTPDNKEKIYLDVLNSGDDLLISLLEDYIETLEAVSEYNTKVNNYIDMKKNLNDISTVQEVFDVYASYTARNLIDDMNR
jgi:hypothetical protein